MMETFTKFDAIQYKLLKNLPDEDSYLNGRFDIEDDYIKTLLIAEWLTDDSEPKTVALVQAVTKSTTRVTPSSLNENQTTNLLSIALPTFIGRIKDWPIFANRFKTSIHDD